MLHSWLGIQSTNQPEYKITIEINKGVSDDKRSKIEGSKKLFRLEEIYSTHFDKALDIALIARCYNNPDYMRYCDYALQTLKSQLKANTLSVFKSYYDYEWLTFG